MRDPRLKRIKPRELERFDGLVYRVEDNIAYVGLVSSEGDQSCGEYPVDMLSSLGIHEHDRFTLTVVDTGGDVRLDFVLIPRVDISAERQLAIRQEVESRLMGYADDPSLGEE